MDELRVEKPLPRCRVCGEPIVEKHHWQHAHQANRRFTDAQFIELYDFGLSDGDIAMKLGVHRSSVRERRATKLGLPPNFPRGYYNQKEGCTPKTALLKTTEGIVYQPISRPEHRVGELQEEET